MDLLPSVWPESVSVKYEGPVCGVRRQEGELAVSALQLHPLQQICQQPRTA